MVLCLTNMENLAVLGLSAQMSSVRSLAVVASAKVSAQGGRDPGCGSLPLGSQK